MNTLIVSAMVALIVLVGLWLACKQRSKKQATMTGREWQTKRNAYRVEERIKGQRIG